MPANCGLFVRDLETAVRTGLRGGPCSPVSTGSKMALHRAIASFVAREGHRPPGSNGLVVDLRQDRDQTNPGCRQW